MILALALACAPETSSTFEAYDPSEPVAEAATSTAEPVEGTREYSTLSLTEAPVWKAPRASRESGNVVGFTAPTTGRWTYPGQEPGYASGDAACRAIGGTHVCTVAELQRADVAGHTAGVPAGMQVWVDSGDRATPDDFSVADTCSGYRYEGADRWWQFSNTSYRVDADGVARLTVVEAPQSLYDAGCLKSLEVCNQVVPSGFECNEVRSIACCF